MLRCFLSWGRFSSSLRGQLKTHKKVRLKHNMLIVFHWLQIEHMLFIIWATLKRILAMLRLNVFALLLITCTDFQKSPASEPSWWWKWKKGIRVGWGKIDTMSYFCTESFWAKQCTHPSHVLVSIWRSQVLQSCWLQPSSINGIGWRTSRSSFSLLRSSLEKVSAWDTWFDSFPFSEHFHF